jgi:hypothetical protein
VTDPERRDFNLRLVRHINRGVAVLAAIGTAAFAGLAAAHHAGAASSASSTNSSTSTPAATTSDDGTTTSSDDESSSSGQVQSSGDNPVAVSGGS